MTKINEEVKRTDLKTSVLFYKENDPRGEYVLIIEGAKNNSKREFWVDMNVIDHVNHYISYGMAKNDAIKAAAKDRGVPKNEIYS